MSNVENFIRATLQRVSGISGVFIGFIEYYLNYVNDFNYESEPDYSKIHRKITETLEYLIMAIRKLPLTVFILWNPQNCHHQLSQSNQISC